MKLMKHMKIKTIVIYEMKRLIFNFPETIFFHAYLYVFVYKKKNREVSEEMRSKFKLKYKRPFHGS